MKGLKPAHKEKKRFILIKIETEDGAKKENIDRLVTQASLKFLGELGMAAAGVQFLPETWNQTNQTGIVRVGHRFVNELKAALVLLREFEGAKLAISCLRVSGSLKKIKTIQKEVE